MNKAAEITERQKAAEIELAEAKAAWTAELDASPLTIDVSQIADIVSVTSGVPVSSLTESESRRLLQAESVLKTRIIGQDEAVEAVAKAVRRSRSPLKDPRRPGGSFIFLGPTGTGKTELAKTLAEYLFGSKDALISFDMSEFGSEFEVSKLIGSLRVTSVTTRAASSPRPFVVTRTRSCCSTRSRRRTPISSTSCCRCWRRAA